MAAYPRSTVGFDVPCACFPNASDCLSGAFEQPRALNRERPKASPVQCTGCYPVIRTHAKKRNVPRARGFALSAPCRPAICNGHPKHGTAGYRGVVSWGIRGWYPRVSGGIRGIRPPSGALLSLKSYKLQWHPSHERVSWVGKANAI